MAAAKTAPEEIPPAIPSCLPRIFENWNADVLLIDNTLSITLKSKFFGMKPAPIP